MLIIGASLVALTLLSGGLFHARRKALRSLRGVNQQLEQRVQERAAQLEHSHEELQYREQLLTETGQLAKVGGWDFDPATGAERWTTESRTSTIWRADSTELGTGTAVLPRRIAPGWKPRWRKP